MICRYLILFCCLFVSTSLQAKSENSPQYIDSLLENLNRNDPFDKLIISLNEISRLSHEIGYNKGIIQSNITLGGRSVNAEPGILKKSLTVLDSIYGIDSPSFSETDEFKYYCLKGTLSNKNLDRTSELNYYFKADSIAEKTKDVNLIVHSYSNILTYYSGINNTDMALKYSRLILDLTEDATDQKGNFAHVVTLINTGNIYYAKEEYDSVIVYMRNSIERWKGGNVLSSNQYLKLGDAYLMKNELDSAEKYANLAGPSLLQAGDLKGTSLNYMVLGQIDMKKNKINSAIDYFTKANNLADSLDLIGREIQSKRHLAKAYLKKSGYDATILDDLKAHSDSLHASRLEEQDKDIMAKFETEKKELLIAKLNVENSRSKAIIFSAVVIGLLIALFLIFNFKAKKKILEKKVENKQLENELLNFNLKKAIEKVTDHTRTINKLKEDIQNSNSDIDMIDELSRLLDQNYISDNHWQKIISYFDKLNDFFTEKIKKKYSTLTKNDIRLLVLIKSHYSNKAIAEVKNVSESSVKKSKQRLLSKVELDNFDQIIV